VAGFELGVSWSVFVRNFVGDLGFACVFFKVAWDFFRDCF